MELGKTETFDFIVSDPTTGSPINADSLPTVSVYEDTDVAPMYSPAPALRGPAIGHYLVTLIMTEANGFEKGKSYNVVISATVGGVDAKSVLVSFSIEDTMEKKTNVAAMLNNILIPPFFEPDMSAFIEPLVPSSMADQFGPDSPYEFRDLFTDWYDQEKKEWKVTAYGAVPAEVMAEVLIAQEAQNYYEEQSTEYKYNQYVQREVQWRAYMAEKLLDVTE